MEAPSHASLLASIGRNQSTPVLQSIQIPNMPVVVLHHPSPTFRPRRQLIKKRLALPREGYLCFDLCSQTLSFESLGSAMHLFTLFMPDSIRPAGLLDRSPSLGHGSI